MQGDSGDGLVTYTANGSGTLVGVYAFSWNRAQNRSRAGPGFFMSVDAYREFILDRINVTMAP